MEEALIEMYLAGVSVRRVEDITEALWGSKVSPLTISELNKKVYSTLRTGGTVPYRVGVTRMCTWTASICGATGRFDAVPGWLVVFRMATLPLCWSAPCGRHPVGQQEIHEHEAFRGGSGRCFYCRLTSF